MWRGRACFTVQWELCLFFDLCVCFFVLSGCGWRAFVPAVMIPAPAASAPPLAVHASCRARQRILPGAIFVFVCQYVSGVLRARSLLAVLALGE